MPTIPKKISITNVSADVINAIRNEGFSTNYRDYVPEVTPDADSIRAAGAIIMDNPALRNSFLNDLINRVIKVIVTSKMYENPWARLKKGKLDLGETIEEVFVNIAKAELYDPANASATIFKRRIPDVRAAFHVVNYQVMYPVSISNDELSMAFTTQDGLYNLIERIYESLYTADAYDEFNVMKYELARHILAGQIPVVGISALSSEANIRAAVTTIKATSNKMKFMTDKYNISGVKTHAKHEEQTVIVSADFDAAMDVQVLAAAFNMDKAEFLSKRLLVDGFGTIDAIRLAETCPELCENIQYDSDGHVTDADIIGMSSNDLTALNAVPAVLIDDAFMQIWDRLITMEDIRVVNGLYTNAFLHCWKYIGVSPYAPAAVFASGSSSVSTVTVSPSAGNTVKGGDSHFSATVAGSGFFDRSVTWTISGAAKAGTHIDAAGNLHVASDETAQTITVTATSNADSTKTDTATVTVYDNLTVYNGEIVIPNP